jgi:serine/threonine protein kinase/tetratricopeptide (TPR) repeat protein
VPDSRTQLDQPFAGRYATERELGRGGMAMVYLAQDLAGHRRVALKVFHPELMASIGPARFLREISIVADLTHPNILPLHESGESAGLLYYATPYVEGGSLRARLQREIQLPLKEALRITRGIADALDYAHARGLIHRDVKPENVLLAGDRAILADFGVARAVEVAAGERVTETGLAVGTPAYMSPEQAGGSSRLDGRSDIYSLGCVLYEMLAGEPPFSGPTSQAIAAKHLQQHPPPLHVIRDTVPSVVETAVQRALAKVPADRFATAGDFAEALIAPDGGPVSAARKPSRWVPRLLAISALVGAVFGVWRSSARSGSPPANAAVLPEVPRIAVLYFEARTRDSTVRQIADGLTEDLIHELSGVNAFRVISKNGVRAYRDRQVTFDSMVSALRVTTVIDGSVQRSGDRLRIRVDLIDAPSDTYLDSLSFERPISDFLSLEREVAQQVAAALRRQMGKDVRLRGTMSGTRSARAKDLMLKAQSARGDAQALSEHSRPEDTRTAIEALGRADSLLALAQAEDAGWLRPTVERGWVAHDRANLVNGPARAEDIDRGLRFAEKAARSEPDNPELLQLRGTLRWEQVTVQQGDSADSARLGRAEADLRAAVDRDSTLAGAWATLSYLLWFKGSTAEAELTGRRALREDAYLADARGVFAHMFLVDLWLGDFGQAEEWCRRGRTSFPGHWRFVECELTLMWYNTAATPDPDSGWALVKQLEALDPGDKAIGEDRAYHLIYRRIVAATISARAGHRDIARAELVRARHATEGNPTLAMDLACDEAYLRLVLGDTARAVALLRSYVTARPMARTYIARDPLFRGVRF